MHRIGVTVVERQVRAVNIYNSAAAGLFESITGKVKNLGAADVDVL